METIERLWKNLDFFYKKIVLKHKRLIKIIGYSKIKNRFILD
jgi:hypothetical protein